MQSYGSFYLVLVFNFILQFTDKIKNLRLARNLTQADVAKGISLPNNKKLSTSAIGMYEQDRRKPSFEVLEAFADFFNVDLNSLSDNYKSQSSDISINFQPKGVQIPVLGYVIAGVPISAVEDILGYEEIPKKLADTGDFFALRIKGASMEPQFFDGDTVIVRQQSDVDDNDIAIVLVNGDEATVKQIKKSDAGITLIGFNVSVYPPHFYSNNDIESLPVSIIGKVVQVRRDY